MTALAAPRRATRTALLGGAAALLAVGIVLRAIGLHDWLWRDEAQAVLIARHSLGDLPGQLKLDGAPPLYYALLHVWMSVFGSSEAAVRSLSVVISLATIPVAYLVGTRLGGRLAGVVLTVLVTTSSMLVTYGDQVRMYSLLPLLGLIAAMLAVEVLAEGRSGRRWALGVALAALLYTHAWSFFFVAGVLAAGVVAAVLRRSRRPLVDIALAALTAAVLFAPWLPVFLSQLRHTGAPWTVTPSAVQGVKTVALLFGGGAAFAVAVVAIAAAAWWVRRERLPAAVVRQEGVLLTIVAAGLLAAWVAAHVHPSWTSRYSIVFVTPLLLAIALVAARWRAGLLAAGVIAAAMLVVSARDARDRTHRDHFDVVARASAAIDRERPQQAMIALDELPVLAYYQHGATPRATLTEPDRLGGVQDWRDVMERLHRTNAAAFALGRLRALPHGARLTLVAFPSSYLDNGSEYGAAMARAQSAAIRALDRAPQTASRRVEQIDTMRLLTYRRR